MSSNSQSTAGKVADKVEQVVQGSGQWKPGTTVQEIQGSFSGKNVPENDPISKTGGVPNVDFDPKNVKDTIGGRKE